MSLPERSSGENDEATELIPTKDTGEGASATLEIPPAARTAVGAPAPAGPSPSVASATAVDAPAPAAPATRTPAGGTPAPAAPAAFPARLARPVMPPLMGLPKGSEPVPAASSLPASADDGPAGSTSAGSTSTPAEAERAPMAAPMPPPGPSSPPAPPSPPAEEAPSAAQPAVPAWTPPPAAPAPSPVPRASQPSWAQEPLVPAAEPDQPSEPPPAYWPPELGPPTRSLVMQSSVPAPPAPPAPVRAPRPSGRMRTPVVLVLAALAVAAIVVLGILVWKGQQPTRNPATAKPSVATKPVTLNPRYTSFDPSGGSGLRQDGNDGWRTQTYRSARFGGLKPGVGLVIDLGSTHELTAVSFDTGSSFTAELRSADSKPSGIDGWTKVGSSTTADGNTSLSASGGGKHRYWMIWITELGSGGGYKASFTDVKVAAKS